MKYDAIKEISCLMSCKRAKHKMHGISANVMCGQLGFYGTNSFQLLVDHTKYADEPVDDGVEDNSDIQLSHDSDGRKITYVKMIYNINNPNLFKHI